MNNSTANTTKKHPGGRPTKYDPKFIAAVDDYLNSIRDNHGKFKEGELPGVEEFALYIGVDDDTVNVWAKVRKKDENGKRTKELKYPEFSAAIKRLKLIQKNYLMMGGLFGKTHPVMSIFLLKANHGMIETQHLDHTTKGERLPEPAPIYNGESTKTV